MIDLSWKIAFKNLLRNRRRSLATGIAVVSGFIGMTLLGAYVYRVEKILRVNTVYVSHVGHISIFKKDSLENFYVRPRKYILTKEDQEHVAQMLIPWKNEVELTTGNLIGVGLLSNGNKSAPFNAIGITPESDRYVNTHPFVIKWAPEYVGTYGEENLSTILAHSPSAISVTRSLGELIGVTPPFAKKTDEQRAVQMAARNYLGDLNAVNADIRLEHTTGVMFLESTGLRAPLAMMQELFATDGLSSISIFLKEGTPHRKVLADLRSQAAKNNWPLDIYPFDDDNVGPFYSGTMGFLTVLVAFFSFLIVGAVSLSIVNSMTMGILERTKEIGTLRAIGFQPGSITSLFIKEALLMTLISAIVGTILALIIATVVNSLNLQFFPPGSAKPIQFRLAPNFWISVLIIIAFFILSYLTSFIVVYRKTQTRIVDLLTDSGA